MAQMNWTRLCRMSDAKLIKYMSTYPKWSELEKSESFRKFTYVEQCACRCEDEFCITVRKDKADNNAFHIEIAKESGQFTIVTKRKFGYNSDLYYKRRRVQHRPFAPLNLSYHQEGGGLQFVKGTPIEDEWSCFPSPFAPR